MTSVSSPCAAIRDQLLSQSNSNFVIFSPSGQVMEQSGEFTDNKVKCEAACSMLQQCSALLKPHEKLKRVTVTFEDAVYVASVTQVSGKPYGVVVKRAAVAV
jgi:hypothetical protein